MVLLKYHAIGDSQNSLCLFKILEHDDLQNVYFWKSSLKLQWNLS